MIKGKKVLLAFMILVMIIPQLQLQKVSAKAEDYQGSTAYCTANELYLRCGPGTEYDIISLNGEKVILKKGQEVGVTDVIGEWFYINLVYNGVFLEGFSFGSYFSSENPLEGMNENPEAVPEITPTQAPEIPVTDDPSPTQEAPAATEAPVTDTPEQASADTIVFSYKNAIYEIPAYTSASALNLRKSASVKSKKITTVTNGTDLTIINSKMVNDKRWYLVAVKVKKKTKTGYMLSDYVTLSLDDSVKAQTRVKNVKIYSKPSTAKATLKDKEGSVIKLKKKTSVTIISEYTDDKGVKWFRIKFKYGGKTKKGYVQASKVSFTDLTQAVVKTETASQVTPEPVKNDEPALDLEGGNAYLIDTAKSLAVKETADYSSGVVKDASGTPIILYAGHALEIIRAEQNEDAAWYYVRFKYKDTEYFGYINSTYIKLVGKLELLSEDNSESKEKNTDFETKLEAEGFPESYKEPLRLLHAAYPNWQFKAFHTGLKWDDVITDESQVGKNLIPSTKSIEWLSLEKDAYSWKKDQFIAFDGATWVTASKEAVEYYMDPRNFMAENSIFMFEVLTYQPDYQNLEGIENVLKNSAMANASYEYTDIYGDVRNITYSETFAMAAEYSGVSPFHLASRVKQEIVAGTNAFSNSVTGTVEGFEGLYNFYNIGAYHSTESGGAIRNGLTYARNGGTSAAMNLNCLIPWNNRLRSIVGGAFYIGNNYINRGQDTIYLQKFNVTGKNTYTHQYMANIEAPHSEGRRVFAAYENPAELPIVFSIPVYEDMPETACSIPEKKYNPNNWLRTLKILDTEGNKLSLTPTFDASKDQEYSIIVGNETSSIEVKATSASSKAEITGKGSYELTVGSNRICIQVTAENGDLREYAVTVVREETSTPDGQSEDDQSGEDGEEADDQSEIPDEGIQEGIGDTESGEPVQDDLPEGPVIIP